MVNMKALNPRLEPYKQWLASQAGKALACAESRLVSRLLGNIHGFQGLLAGASPHFLGSVEADRFTHLVRLELIEEEKVSGDVQAWVDCLPFCSELFDVAVLGHVLEWQRRVHPVLLEWNRMLKPGGHLLLIMNRSLIGPVFPRRGPVTPRGYWPWLTERQLRMLGFERLARYWLLPDHAMGSALSRRLAVLHAPVIAVHLRKTRRQGIIHPVREPAGATVSLT